MATLLLRALLAAAVLAGCGPGVAPGTPSTPPSNGSAGPGTGAPSAGATQPTGSAAPAGTPVVGGPAVTITLDERGPIIRSADGPEGLPYVLPAAAALDADGKPVLITEWFGAPGAQLPTGSRSDDGRAWTVGQEAIFTDLGLGLTDPGPIPQSLLRLAQSRRESGVAGGHLERAAIPDAHLGPWFRDHESVPRI